LDHMLAVIVLSFCFLSPDDLFNEATFIVKIILFFFSNTQESCASIY
jgi:hypothetical protein